MKSLIKSSLLVAALILFFGINSSYAQEKKETPKEENKTEKMEMKEMDHSKMNHDMHKDMDHSKMNHEMNKEMDDSKMNHEMNNNEDMAAAKPFNKYCPVRGGEVDPEVETVEYNGKNYGFCCGGCDSKFTKDPEKYSKNLNEDGTEFIGKK